MFCIRSSAKWVASGWPIFLDSGPMREGGCCTRKDHLPQAGKGAWAGWSVTRLVLADGCLGFGGQGETVAMPGREVGATFFESFDALAADELHGSAGTGWKTDAQDAASVGVVSTG